MQSHSAHMEQTLVLGQCRQSISLQGGLCWVASFTISARNDSSRHRLHVSIQELPCRAGFPPHTLCRLYQVASCQQGSGCRASQPSHVALDRLADIPGAGRAAGVALHGVTDMREAVDQEDVTRCRVHMRCLVHSAGHLAQPGKQSRRPRRFPQKAHQSTMFLCVGAQV